MRQELPLVSVVTPSYNKGAFIEETILSVKNQTYPRIEHIVVDGGSSDSTLDILRKYNDTIVWTSEPDKGQSDAINKGWQKAHGEILAYLNADDTYMLETVEEAVKFLSEHPEVSLVYGDCNIVNEHNELISYHQLRELNLLEEMICAISSPEPTIFLRREVLNKVGYLDTSLNMGWDWDFWIRAGLCFSMRHLPHLLVNIRLYPETKTASESHKFWPEYLYILDKTFNGLSLPGRIRSLRSKAYSYAYLRLGLEYFNHHQWKQAIKHMVKSFILCPILLLYPPYFKKALLLIKLTVSFFKRKMTQIVIRRKE